MWNLYPATVGKSGNGILELDGSNTYTGSTTISSGTLQLGDGTSGHDGSIANTSGVSDNGALVYNLYGNQTAGYAVSGSGSLTKTGQGLLVLSGTNTYNGGTAVNGGTLQIVGSGTLGDERQPDRQQRRGRGHPGRAIGRHDQCRDHAGPDQYRYVQRRSGIRRPQHLGNLNISGGTNAWTGLVDLGNTGMVITGCRDRHQLGKLAGRPHDPRSDQSQAAALEPAARRPGTARAGLPVRRRPPIRALSAGLLVSGSTVTVAAVVPGDTLLQGHVSLADRTALLLGLSNTAMNNSRRRPLAGRRLPLHRRGHYQDLAIWLANAERLCLPAATSCRPARGSSRPDGRARAHRRFTTRAAGALTLRRQRHQLHGEPGLGRGRPAVDDGRSAIGALTGSSGTWQNQMLTNFALEWYTTGTNTLAAGNYSAGPNSPRA